MNCSTCGGASNGDACFSCGETWAACCCPKPAVDSCPGECGVVTVTGLAKCNESQLNLNNCTLIVESEVAPSDLPPYTARKIISEAYALVNTSSICTEFPDVYLDFFNSAVRYINTYVEPLWESAQAIVKTCGRCKFNTPPQYIQIIAVTDEVQNCNTGCNPKKYRYVVSEEFTAGRLVNSFTVRENKIIIKDPAATGQRTVVPNFLMIDYYKKIKQVGTFDEVLDIDDDAASVLIDWIIANKFGVKFDNELAIKKSQDNLEKYENSKTSYDSRKVVSAHYTQIRPSFRLRK